MVKKRYFHSPKTTTSTPSTKKRLRAHHSDYPGSKSQWKLDQQRSSPQNIQKPRKRNLTQHENQPLNCDHETNHNLVTEKPSRQGVLTDPKESPNLAEEQDGVGRSRREQIGPNLVHLSDKRR